MTREDPKHTLDNMKDLKHTLLHNMKDPKHTLLHNMKDPKHTRALSCEPEYFVHIYIYTDMASLLPLKRENV